jgi:hypothetical protein
MNYIKHLSGFFDQVSKDERLNPTHISLYVSLFQFWNASRFHNPISISRSEVMKVSKIASKATYHKCIKDLNQFGYLDYKPSYNPFKGSLVYLFNFDPSRKQAEGYSHTKTGTGTEQAEEPYINNTNINKQQTDLNAYESKNKSSSDKDMAAAKGNGHGKGTDTAAGEKKEKLREKKKDGAAGLPPFEKTEEGFKRPLLPELRDYFAKQSWPVIEAEKFFNHYESIGWLVGGKTPMQNWQASAANWIINAEIFGNKTQSKPGSIAVNNSKDFSEPL